MSNRRGFLRSLVGEVVRGAQEIAPALSLPDDLLLPVPEVPDVPQQPAGRRTIRAASVKHRLTLGELLALAEQLGLAARLDGVRALARRSFRLTLGDADEDGSLGAAPTLPSGTPWPDWNGDSLPLLAQIDLAELGEDAASGPLPAQGLLSIFCASGGALASTSPERAEATRVLWSDGDHGGVSRLAQRAAAVSSELTLPRVWAAPVRALQLTADEQTAWQQLRTRLAELQDVALADAVDTTDEIGALHRLLGYPDERHGDMPLQCELVAHGIDLEGAAAYAHPRASELEPAAGRWRLLLQLTADDELGWSWGEGRDRLYLWIDEQDLAARDFSRVWAIAQ